MSSREHFGDLIGLQSDTSRVKVSGGAVRSRTTRFQWNAPLSVTALRLVKCGGGGGGPAAGAAAAAAAARKTGDPAERIRSRECNIVGIVGIP